MESNKQALAVSCATSMMRSPALPPLKIIIDADNNATINKDGVGCLQQGLPTSPKTPNTAQKYNTSDDDGKEGSVEAYSGTSYITSPPSKFPVSQPSPPTTMSNHNNTSYNDGYDSNGLLPCYDDIADMGKDPDSYKGDANLLIFPPKDPPTAIATEKCSTLTINTVKNTMSTKSSMS